jgi:hypothetical protein
MIAEIEYVSPLQVMKSQAGWYVGQGYWSSWLFPDQEFKEEYPAPYCRNSGYFATQEEAEQELAMMMRSEQ